MGFGARGLFSAAASETRIQLGFMIHEHRTLSSSTTYEPEHSFVEFEEKLDPMNEPARSRVNVVGT
jgi:hypothetical protein